MHFWQSGDVMTDVSVWPDNFSLFTILLIPFLIIEFISGDVLTDVSVWADNFSLYTILLIPFLIIIFISGDVLTDVSVWAGQTMYSAHRLVLALSSSYFRLHFIISFFLAPILNMCSLIDLMGKSMTKKVGQMMWCGSYQNNRKTLDRVQQRSSPKLLSEYMILLREPFHVKFLDLFQLIYLILISK